MLFRSSNQRGTGTKAAVASKANVSELSERWQREEFGMLRNCIWGKDGGRASAMWESGT